MANVKLFPPAIAAILITGAIAAMVSTTRLFTDTVGHRAIGEPAEEKKRGRAGKQRSLLLSRSVTALLAVVALGLAYISPSRLIFTLVSYVWAGIGCTFSVVIIYSLF
ncbi:MAG: hypothetical protein R2744_09405 [Bacteroidales bacterium]